MQQAIIKLARLILIVIFLPLLNSCLIDIEEPSRIARAHIEKTSCDELAASSLDALEGLVDSLLLGKTGDADERALLKLFNCISCSRFRELLTRVGQKKIEKNVHGLEFSELRILYEACGLENIFSWDDDTTRTYINKVNCSQIASRPLNEILALINNLFKGKTGDADEQAILRLLNCLDTNTVVAILNSPGFSRPQFDKEFHGKEQDDLDTFFEDRGIF